MLDQSDYRVLEFFLFLIALWIGWSFLYSFISGWHTLAAVYRTPEVFDGDYWEGQRARVGNWPYKHVDIGASSGGIYLAFSYFFRLSHRPLFIPWSDISTKLKKGLIMNSVELHFRLAPTVSLQFDEDLYRGITRRVGSSLDLEPPP